MAASAPRPLAAARPPEGLRRLQRRHVPPAPLQPARARDLPRADGGLGVRAGRGGRGELDGRPGGGSALYETAPGDVLVLREGEAEGRLLGGCLSILAAAAGTPWALRPDPAGTILFLEDLDEKPYKVDRMLLQLRSSGAFEGVRGIVFGDMKGCNPPASADFTLEDVIRESLAGLEIPVAFGLSSGHVTGQASPCPWAFARVCLATATRHASRSWSPPWNENAFSAAEAFTVAERGWSPRDVTASRSGRQ